MTAAEFKAARLEMGITQKLVADSTGHRTRTVQRWEAGESPIKPKVATLIRHWLAEHRKQPRLEV